MVGALLEVQVLPQAADGLARYADDCNSAMLLKSVLTVDYFDRMGTPRLS